MHTLNRNITKTFFVSDDGFDALRAHWSAAVQSKQKLPAHLHLLYAVARGKDYRKGFAEVTSPVKIANGMDPQTGLRNAVRELRAEAIAHPQELITAMGNTLTLEGLNAAIALLPTADEVSNGRVLGANAYFLPAMGVEAPLNLLDAGKRALTIVKNAFEAAVSGTDERRRKLQDSITDSNVRYEPVLKRLAE